MNTKALWSVAVLGTVAAFFTACGDGDSTKIKICNAKQSTCLTEAGGQVCSADGTTNLPFDCGEGQRCCDPKVKDAKCGEDVTTTTCVGDCTPGATECGSKGVSLRCSDDGRRWVPTDCPVGTGCDDDEKSDTYGTCVNSDDPENVVVICTGGDKACADDNTSKACEPDGTNWVYTACASNEVCDDGACVLDPAKGCVPHSGTCEDKTHLKMCNDDGDGYEKTIACPKDTTCEDGACQGPVCPIGAIRCDDVRVGESFVNSVANGSYQPQSVYHCNDDGTGWDISTCAANEICIYDNISRNTVDTYLHALISTTSGAYPVLTVPSSSRASCENPQCTAPFVLRSYLYDSVAFENTSGSFTCGDALDPEADPLGSYSLCEGLPPYNNLYWANYACQAPEQCVYQGSPATVENGFITGPTCSATCVPGTKACTSPRNGEVGSASTTGEATVTCGDDGTWDYGTVEKCESDDHRELWCGPNLQGTADNYNIGTCMEPACAAWFEAFDTFALPENIGACGTDGKFYPCKSDGTFGDAQECADCTLAGSNVLPSVSTAPETFAGYDPGQCVTCPEGAQQCLFTNGSTPYYRVCNDGTWSTKACSSKLCWEYQDPSTALESVLCGGECTPFTASCGGPDGKQIATCNEDGVLGDFKDCGDGACHTDNLGNDPLGGSAVCEVECIPGTFLCGSTLEAVKCTSKGRYDVLNPTTCDVSSPQKPESCFAKLGCAECDPGTFSGGVPQVRCALDDDGLPAVPAAVEICKDGHWDDSIACPGSDTSCYLGACSSVEPPPGEGGNGGQSNGTSGQGGNSN